MFVRYDKNKHLCMYVHGIHKKKEFESIEELLIMFCKSVYKKIRIRSECRLRIL